MIICTNVISIHALLAESDNREKRKYPEQEISIHALLAESDNSVDVSGVQGYHFYPRSPCGERPHANRYYVGLHLISIHALLAESDFCGRWPQGPHNEFLSTLSLRRATPAPVARRPHAHISIHALLAESDVLWVLRKVPLLDFYPRSPCGERRGGL